MAENPQSPRGNGGAENRVPFDYLKSQFFRVIRADGAIGSITPNGHIHFALYSERPAIPRRLVHSLDDEGNLGGPIVGETVSRGSVVREMDVDVFMTVEAAESLSTWLRDKVNEARAEMLEPGQNKIQREH